MNLKTKLTLITALIINAVLMAQSDYTLTGTVTDEANVPVPGVNVIIQNTTTGTSTDFDGNYSITVKSGDVLEFSSLGYSKKVITINGQQTLNVVLAEDASQLEEVVVVGYGSRKKSDITGSVASVKSEELNAFPLASAEQALQGRAAGVVVQSNNGGEPGAPISIKVRGNTSIGANSAPLVVVDGFVGATMPQPSDIQSIEVLKDASATAIYGSRGSGGVVLVTTKKGRSGKISVEVNTNYSIQSTANRLDLLNADEFARYQQIINPAYVQGPEDTDWQDVIYTTGSTENHQFSFSGGSEKINFYASANYFKQDGIVVNSDFEKLTFLSNIDAQVTDKLKLGMNLFGSRGVKNGVLTQSTGSDPLGSVNGGGDDVVSLAFRFTPDRGIYDENGDFTQNSVGDGVENPYAVANELRNETTTDSYRTNLYANYDLLENLTFKTTFGYSTLNETVGYFKPQTFQLSTGGASLSDRRTTNVLSENYLTYNAKIGKGNLTLLGGYSYQKTKTIRFSASTQELLSDDFLWYNLAAGHVETRRVSSSFSESEIQSQFGRLNYDFDDKYLLTATVRRDGASNFAENEKYAIFPSGAIGWKISNENFLKDSETISNLKLRASYGVTGNQAISPYQSLAELAVTPSTAVATDPSISVSQEANPDLKWESSYQTNVGLDLGLFNNRISLSLDYYNIDTKDLLLETATSPAYSGATDLEVFSNVGEINNRGFEISLSTRNISNDNFSWTTDFNLSANKNEVIKLNNGDIIDSAAPGYFSSGKDTYILREGEAIGLFWGHEYRGVYQGGDLPAGTALKGSFSEPGDPLFTDVDGSGEIDTGDQKIIGDPNPDFTFGFTNNFRYKNLDLNIFFQGSQGGEIMNLTNVQLYNGDSNSVSDIFNAWTPTNTDTNIPSNKIRDREISSRFIEDGSYIRLKNIAIGYNFPTDIVERFGVDNLRVSVSAQNLWTITNYSGLDPEVSYFGSGGGDTGSANVVQGHDFGNYPTVKSVNFNLSLKF
ncbi:TonB-dependent receptor [Maribacter sp. MMG018]|uniref:SusC/RagA family TonB-linked outer membrane protein n=1 Tax=Maribacter sp. MMG018 TaxID=2822688 RepID=UPI001B37D2D6|nr:TonB-dependent receptor [Maribacter sp. MMG018]MBQ4913653.1 TonB-dependent receptor [Maribacter sp. MMG018]